jgi:hypothetical protein
MKSRNSINLNVHSHIYKKSTFSTQCGWDFQACSLYWMGLSSLKEDTQLAPDVVRRGHKILLFSSPHNATHDNTELFFVTFRFFNNHWKVKKYCCSCITIQTLMPQCIIDNGSWCMDFYLCNFSYFRILWIFTRTIINNNAALYLLLDCELAGCRTVLCSRHISTRLHSVTTQRNSQKSPLRNPQNIHQLFLVCHIQLL